MSRLRTTQDPSVRLDATNGAVRSFFGTELIDEGAKPQGLALNPSKSDDFLASNRGGFKLDGIELKEVGRRAGSATESVIYQQSHDGIPVYGAQLVVGLQKADGKVASAVNQIDYGLPPTLSAADVVTTAAQAASVARDGLRGLVGDVVVGAPSLFVYRRTTRSVRAGSTPESERILGLSRGQPDQAYVAWLVPTDTKEPNGNWDLFVDARSGIVVDVVSRRRDAPVKGFAFVPDPITTSRDPSLSTATSADILDRQRREVDLGALETGADGRHVLAGRWCYCRDLEAPVFAPPTEPAEFKYGSQDRKFLWVMAYYWVTQAIEHVRSFGNATFNAPTEAVRLAIDAQGLRGADNSHFTTDAGGTPYLAFGEGGVPDASDAHVIIHEFGHAMHWYIGTSQNLAGNEEGFGDFLAGSFLDRFNAAQFGRNEVFPWDNNKANRYSSDRFFDTKRRFDDPEHDHLEVHARGSVLAATLWELFLDRGGASEAEDHRRAAADAVLHIYAEMLVSAAQDAPVADLANGMITADRALNTGRHGAAIKRAFEGRGLNLGGVRVA